MSEHAHRVLVVEDDPIMCELVAAVLRNLGCDVVAAAQSDAAAMAAFKANRPEIAFVDLDLGGSNGLDVLRRIRGIAPDARVVMLTATDDPTVAEHCLVNGAQGYIVKGGADELESAIAAQLVRP